MYIALSLMNIDYKLPLYAIVFAVQNSLFTMTRIIKYYTCTHFPCATVYLEIQYHKLLSAGKCDVAPNVASEQKLSRLQGKAFAQRALNRLLK